MNLKVREMRLDEVGMIIDYFHQSPVGHLEMMGVDPTKLPNPEALRLQTVPGLLNHHQAVTLWVLEQGPVSDIED